MSSVRVISDSEIDELTNSGKGFTKAQCEYYLYLCTIGVPAGSPRDSGTCSWIMQQCGYNPGTPGGGGGCSTCTCH